MASNKDDIEKVLQSCLDLISDRQESVESVLARYPEYADELRPQLEASIWLIKFNERLDPRPGFVSASRRRLVTRIQQETKAKASPNGLLNRIPFWQAWLRRAWVPLTVSLVLLVSLFGLSSSVVMAAQDSLPGDTLYPVKITLEKVALAVSLDKTHAAQLSLEYTQRRSAEINRLLVAGRYDDINTSVESFEEQVNQTIESFDDVANQDDEQVELLASSLKHILANQNQVFAKLIESAPASAKPAIAKAIRVSNTGVNAAEDMIEEPTTSGPVASPTSPATVFRPTNTPTRRAVVAPFSTPTRAPDFTPTTVPTDAPLPTKTQQPTDAPQPTKTFTPRPSATGVPTNAPTATPTPTDTPTPTPTNTPTNTATPTPTNTHTPSPTPEATETPTPTTPPPSIPSLTPTATDTAISTSIETPTAAPTETLTATELATSGSPTEAIETP